MIKAVIFDLDGVIVSTDHLHYLAWKQMADQEQIYFDEHINHQLRGVSRLASLEIILKKSKKIYTDQEKLELATYKNNVYQSLLKDLSKDDILPHAVETIKALKEKHIKIAIGSSSKNTPIILKQIGLSDMFDGIADGNDITHSKPDPEVFLLAAQKVNIDSHYCMVVEDAEAGIKAAKSAGMFAFAVGDAKKSRLADATSDDLLDILKYIK